MVFYATRNLQVGEEITQSYANLGDDGRLTRMENIEVSWGLHVHACAVKSIVVVVVMKVVVIIQKFR